MSQSEPIIENVILPDDSEEAPKALFDLNNVRNDQEEHDSEEVGSQSNHHIYDEREKESIPSLFSFIHIQFSLYVRSFLIDKKNQPFFFSNYMFLRLSFRITIN